MTIHTYDLAAFVERYNLPGIREFDSVMAKLPKCTPQGPWLGGGALRRIVRGDQPNSDWDFFFASHAQLDAFNEAIGPLVPRGGKTVREHNITFAAKVDDKTVKVQAIKLAFYADVEAVLDSFDFTICQFGYDGEKLHVSEWALFDLARNRLAVNKISFAAASVRRMLKYQTQGYTVCQGAVTALLEAVSKDPSLIQSEVAYVD